MWGWGAIAGGLFPPDPRGHWDRPPSWSGMIHGGAAMAAFLAFPAAARLLSRAFERTSPGTRLLRRLAASSALLLAVFFVCLSPVFSNRPPLHLGLVERLLLVCYLAWIAGAGLLVRRPLEH